MAEEFRFVVKNIEKFNPQLEKAADFTDYYLDRNKRVRTFIKDFKGRDGKFFFITSEPGSIYKKSEEISKAVAETLIQHAVLIVTKKGIGHIQIEDIQGYSENVSATKPGKKKPFIDEVQIEFEVEQKLMAKLDKAIKPTKIIKVGLFDYLSEKSGDKK